MNLNDPNSPVGSSVTKHMKPIDSSGENYQLYALSESLGVKSLRLDVATKLIAGYLAEHGIDSANDRVDKMFDLADAIIKKAQERSSEDAQAKSE